ncbi:hypothetical protein ASPVEDRAFT_42906 [Aspergillus versicolor CBS 583.65]|uniref:FAD/NAD(P)-binding domain-containing protein n=1 Tax=Aspergillus versicolor CBS 583.65 TaxID=1036611 RepID=A0A1L9PPS5_ASPVE|nr:uncharacterized protein ASPVEDRAFT_42906 [Aspergillus versicolor CBS 583.65]OJJ03435.1 hypothetical protein ASPVEDRAFT_42906 [Aspergillus versicolor CBS 583.65]
MASKTVVIIGASFAGIPVAHSLLKQVPSVKVILINPSSTFYYVIAAPRILAKPKAFRSDQYLLPIEREFVQYKRDAFEFILGAVTSIDTPARTVTVDGEKTVPFDYLVIASGSTARSMTNETGTLIPFKPPKSDHVQLLIEEAQRKISQATKIVIAGAGPIGVETAGEIAQAAQDRGADVHITLVSAKERVLPELKPRAGETAEQQLKQLKVEVVKSRKVTGATQAAEGSTWTVSLDNAQTLTADVYIPTVGVVPNNSFIPQEFLDSAGWVTVDKELRVQGKSHSKLPIFAAGDITNNSMRLSFKAAEQAAVVAANLKAEITEKGKQRTYDQGSSLMMVVPVGSSGGTGQLFGWVPWGLLVRMIKGKDFLISRAQSMISAN